MMELLRRFVKNEEGQGLAEYALILVLIAVAVVGALTLLGGRINEIFGQIRNDLSGTGGGGGTP